MAFDIAPEPIRRRGPRIPAILVLAIGISVVIVAVATSSQGQAPSPTAEPVARVVPTAAAAAPTTTTAQPSQNPAPSRRGGRLPSLHLCHHISDAICDAIATASLAVLPSDAPLVTAVDAWDSLLCGDTRDCPPERLTGSQPLGSAVISFGKGGAQAWVNVVERGGGDPVAWVVRWRQ